MIQRVEPQSTQSPTLNESTVQLILNLPPQLLTTLQSMAGTRRRRTTVQGVVTKMINRCLIELERKRKINAEHFAANSWPPGSLDMRGAALFLGVEYGVFRLRHDQGKGPPFFKFGYRVLFRRAELERWQRAEPQSKTVSVAISKKAEGGASC